jgi:hypothetical protein
MKIESLKERWFEAMMTGPLRGTLRNPFTFGRKASIKKGVRNERKMPYGTSSALLITQLLSISDKTLILRVS